MPLTHLHSFQLYSAFGKGEVTEQIRTLAGLGYTNVEPYSYDDPQAMRAVMDETGVTALSGHFTVEQILDETTWVISTANLLGIEVVIAPWIDEDNRPVDVAGWRALGARLEAVEPQFAKAGLTLGWHHHDFEFTALPDGSYPIEHLLGDGPLALEMDLGWLTRIGFDASLWMDRYSTRIVAVHVKDVAAAGENADQDGWAYVGQGVVNWSDLWPKIAKTSARAVIVEHDLPDDWKRFAAESFETVKNLGEPV